MAIWNSDKWNFRISGLRTILVKGKDENKRRIVAEDTSTEMPFILELARALPIESIELGKRYAVNIRVYTIKSAEEVKPEFTELFEVLDVDRPMEDFIRATCCNPRLIRFQIVEIED